MAIFNSDNVTGVCPEVMEALIAANSGVASSYGHDKWSSNLQSKFSEIFETDVVIFHTVSGTASNSLALSVLTPVFGKIYCHELSHINTDECGAPEFFTGGAKLIPMRGANGKITANTMRKSSPYTPSIYHCYRRFVVHPQNITSPPTIGTSCRLSSRIAISFTEILL